jgi:acyl-CoA-dependent ceramide synthase
MADPSEIVPILEEKSEERRWAPETEEAVEDIEDTYQRNQAEEYSSRTITVKKKAKKKDDGPLEIFCAMIVEHQIGKYKPHCFN